MVAKSCIINGEPLEVNWGQTANFRWIYGKTRT